MFYLQFSSPSSFLISVLKSFLLTTEHKPTHVVTVPAQLGLFVGVAFGVDTFVGLVTGLLLAVVGGLADVVYAGDVGYFV